MGMYTELIFGCSLKKDTPREIIQVLQYMVDKSEFKDTSQIKVPDHEFFKTSRWQWLFHGSSYYFGVNEPHSEIWYDDISKDYRISTRSNIKNYDDEIELFLDWIKPYISGGSGQNDFYAIVIYEESEKPTIYYLKESE